MSTEPTDLPPPTLLQSHIHDLFEACREVGSTASRIETAAGSILFEVPGNLPSEMTLARLAALRERLETANLRWLNATEQADAVVRALRTAGVALDEARKLAEEMSGETK